MTSVLTIEGKEYVPATIAGKHFGYTKDYILLLTKQGHIDGQKIGNKWYVHIPSAEKYFRVAQAKREVRKKVISQERKAELKKYSHVRTQAKKSSSYRLVGIEAIVVVVLALSIGATGYVGSIPQQATVHEGAYGFFEYIARSLYALISPEPEVTVVTHATSQTSHESGSTTMEEESVSAFVGTTTRTSIIVAPDELFTATTVESIQDSFSDPVEVSVDPKNPQTGIITPVFKEKKGENYRFLMVPVTEHSPP